MTDCYLRMISRSADGDETVTETGTTATPPPIPTSPADKPASESARTPPASPIAAASGGLAEHWLARSTLERSNPSCPNKS